MLPDVAGLAMLGKTFDYLVPEGREGNVAAGTLVRVRLHGRAIGGWVVQVNVEPPPGVRLQPLTKVSSIGPDAGVVALTEWGAWRWAGRRTALLRAASAPHAVRALPAPAKGHPGVVVPSTPDERRLALEALAAGQSVVRLAPAHDVFPLVATIAGRGPTLVVMPGVDDAATLGRRLARAGLPVAVLPGGWAQAAAGGVSLVGARAAAWGPIGDPVAVLVLDAHEETLVDERAPAWSAWVVAAERARRAGIPCVLVSPSPTLEQLSWGQLVLPSRSTERAGWPAVHVVDRRGADPRSGLFSERLVALVRAATPQARVWCVLNRKGRARLLACAACGEVAVCERCGASVGADESGSGLCCRNCNATRPGLCSACGSTRLKTLRAGITRVREQLEALALQPVGEVSADAGVGSDAAVVVGTEALLHRAHGGTVGAVVFLDLDAELLAPRYRAGEQTFALLVRAARVLGGRSGGGLLVVQTRRPEHPAVVAAVRADPGRLAESERQVRAQLGLPPFRAVALLSGAGAQEFATTLDTAERVGDADGIDKPDRLEVLDLADGRWLVRAPDHDRLCRALADVPRPQARLRVDVDPLRL